MRISVGQFRPTGVIEENLEVLRRLTAQAAEEGAGLVVFPEESMLTQRHLVTDTFEEAVDTEWGEFVAALKDMAREYGIAIIAGGYEPSGTPRPYNTLVAVDGSGAELGTYRKLHLYDAFKHKESDTITPGDRDLLSVRIGELTFGLLTCYDLRFPELSRKLAVDGADVLVVPAAWFKGDHKVDHWQTLLKARAVENTVWVVAADTCSDSTIGHSAIVDPLALPVAALEDEREALVTAEVTRDRIEDVRSFLPVLQNRRTDVL
ncbi:carbon-nitrogen hydrolase [Micrococcus sp. HMSC067E09]|uniref:carbon-nitrogen hydrolase family protein n=1 Tax=Micrococcus TaxID=1269 RepID=UPI0008A42B47|nr:MULTISPECIES: carbon-nitrogen hydrolase family protein [Micrococcus]OFR88883.1 carbon-nitrogen hydrolase [Micrococcus sp. HMSC067E09]WIK82000.1 carbon-nitrogen hydrolase family protein [Micrococcus lylae]